jgi:hypothetical protein
MGPGWKRYEHETCMTMSKDSEITEVHIQLEVLYTSLYKAKTSHGLHVPGEIRA